MTDLESPETGERDDGEIEEEIGRLSSELKQQQPQPAFVARPGDASSRRFLDSPWLAAVMLVVAGVMTAINLLGTGVLSDDPATPLIGPDRDPVRETLLFATEEVEAFRAEQGRLPSSLTEVAMSDDFGVTYVPTKDGGYTLTASVGDDSLSYDSDDDPGRFFGELWTGP